MIEECFSIWVEVHEIRLCENRDVRLRLLVRSPWELWTEAMSALQLFGHVKSAFFLVALVAHLDP